LKELVFINGKKVANLKEPLEIGDRVQYLEHKYVVEQQDVSEEDQILILFNKPQ
jgi:hypothetical protein